MSSSQVYQKSMFYVQIMLVLWFYYLTDMCENYPVNQHVFVLQIFNKKQLDIIVQKTINLWHNGFDMMPTFECQNHDREMHPTQKIINSMEIRSSAWGRIDSRCILF